MATCWQRIGFAQIIAVWCALAACAGAAPEDGFQSALPPGVRTAEPLAATETVSFALTLPLRRQPELAETLQRLYDPHDPLFHRFLTPAEFAETFGPTQSDYDAVIAAVRAQGLTVVERHSGRTLLGVSGPAEVVEQMFQTPLRRYQMADGRTFHVPQAEPSLPLALADKVSGVVGLNDAPLTSSPGQASLDRTPRSSSSFGSGPAGGLTPAEVKKAYNLSGVTLNGLGQTLALFELADYTDSDITAFEQQYGLAAATLKRIYLDGQPGSPNTSTNTGEVTEDIEVALGLAPGVKILVYETVTTEQGSVDAYARIADDDLAGEISTSWYYYGRSAAVKNAENQAFAQMAAQGQSMFALTGDSGAYNGGGKIAVSDPGEQPYVTAVGGTTLSLNSDGTYASETTWADPSNTSRGPMGVGSGGGISQYWPIPLFQKNVVSHAPSGQFSATQRNIPDVSLNADLRTPYSLYIKGHWVTSAGTSAATPLWASFAALVNQKRAASGKSPLGFVNPTIYALAENPTSYARDFHDIADGSTNLYYKAVAGYDDATGWGSFNGANLLADLAAASGGVTSQVNLLWDNANGEISLWTISANGASVHTEYGPYPGWTAVSLGDGPDGTTHLLWTGPNGQISLWSISPNGTYTHQEYGPFPGYTAVSLSVGPDNKPVLLWDKTDGTVSLWSVNSNGSYAHTEEGPFPGWSGVAMAIGQDDFTNLLWAEANGKISGWYLSADKTTYVHTEHGPYSGWTAKALSVGPDGKVHLVWNHSPDNQMSLWSTDFSSGDYMYSNYGPYPGYAVKALATGPDNLTHLLWNDTNGTASLWAVNQAGTYTHAEYGPYAGWAAIAISAGP